MRPVLAGRKTQGNLEAHSNGMRFISTRSEVVDIMYSNIKYAIFQPCESEIMVLIHFHLKNPIMIGKKRQKDVQFFTEVVDASQTVDAGRRSMYDPDEMDDEQRERQLRKRLNQAFKDFCKKVDAVAKKNNYEVEFDIPYRDLGFTGNPHKEMVFVQPTLNCLVNLTETPFFVVDLSEVDHVHFERVTYMSKAFDCVLINKDFTKQPWRIDMIDNNDKDAIQEWLTDMELTYTQGPMNLNWKQIMQTIAQDDRFYMNTEEDEVTEKEAGWEFLRLYGREDEEDEDEVSVKNTVFTMNAYLTRDILNTFYLRRMKMILSSAKMPKRRMRRMRKVATKMMKASIRRKKTNLTLMLMKTSKRKVLIGMRWRNKLLQKIDDAEERASNRRKNLAKSQNGAMVNRRREAASNSSRKKDVRITATKLGRDKNKMIVLLQVLNSYDITQL
jgi:predicted aspartyl protease